MFLKMERPDYNSLRKKFQRELAEDLRYERIQKDPSYREHLKKQIESD
jgi:hypothetical protein